MDEDIWSIVISLDQYGHVAAIPECATNGYAQRGSLMEKTLDAHGKARVHVAEQSSTTKLSTRPLADEETKTCFRCLERKPIDCYSKTEWNLKPVKPVSLHRFIDEGDPDVLKRVDVFGDEPFARRRCTTCLKQLSGGASCEAFSDPFFCDSFEPLSGRAVVFGNIYNRQQSWSTRLCALDNVWTCWHEGI
eukprot:TRINITY_DN94537_c0_g1_i1.p1 TRINITY_DN94537_c0_g1~~TRINITY_DN94537_c0_g1_i1.p1  ORF type:complete len:219 (-),score=15.24 TRINITY_DN94537_c0_g1_i1:108-680(-)